MKRAFLAVLAVLLLASNTWARGLIDTVCMDTAAGSNCVTGNDSATVLLIHSNGSDGSVTFTDSSVGGGHTADITVNGTVHHDSAQAKYVATSIYFDGLGGYLQLGDDADWDLGAGDFCVELWWNFGGGIDADCGLIGRYTNDADNWGLQFSANNLLWYYGAGAAWSRAWIPAINTWYHIAMTRIGGTLRWFVNGAQVGANEADATNYATAGALRIGDYSSIGASPATGWADEIAIHKGDGVYATGGFTPNAYPYCD